MPNFSLQVTANVLPFLRGLGPDDRREIRRLLGIIQADPYVDNRAKIVLPRPPAVFTVYVSPRFWIVYRLVGNSLITVYNVGWASTPPAPW